jgi:hypothetical protein
MPQGVGTTKPVVGTSDTFGGHFYNWVPYNGPQSYVQGGDSISASQFGFYNAIFSLYGSVGFVNGVATYRAVPGVMSAGPNPVWRIVWVSLVTGTAGGQAQTAGAEVAAGTNLSGVTVILSAIGY